MLKTYQDYKEWWLREHKGKYTPSLYWGKDDLEAFEEYINGLSQYKLLETLNDWEQ
jgi:hypothetical protein